MLKNKQYNATKFPLLVISFWAVFLFSSCSPLSFTPSPVPPTRTPNTEITVWAWGAGLKGLQANLAGFNQTKPTVKVNLVDVSQNTIYTRLDNGLLAGGLGLPDIVQVETERLDYFTTKFPEGFADLKNWANKFDGQYDILQWSLVQKIGRIRAIPWNPSPVALFFRADLFQKAGIDPTVILTWDDYFKSTEKLKQVEPGVKPLAFIQNDDSLFRILLGQQGVSYYNRDGKINFASPEGVKALGFIKQMFQQGNLYNVADKSEIIEALALSKAAGFAAGADWVNILTSQAPQMAGKWEVMILPAFVAGGERAVNQGGSVLASLRTGKNQEAASEFIEYCLSNTEHQNLMLKQASILPALLASYDDPFYKSPVAYFNNKPIWENFANQARDLKQVFYTKDFIQATDAVTDAQLLSLAKLDPTQALNKKANDLKDLTTRELVKAPVGSP